MLKLADQNVNTLHIEPTDACNAACPQCLREVDITFDKINSNHLTVDQIKKLVDKNTIRNLNKMYMCGNYGDPAAGKYTLEIFKYFRKINHDITLGMNTNGGLRSVDWWKELAEIFSNPNKNSKEYVVWSIDGLEDTNHIYRKNVSWNKVIENASAFISSGGKAHWEMLVFKHNQHQVDQAESLAKKLGFKWFRAKVSRRFENYPVEFLNPPIGWQRPVINPECVNCQAIQNKSIYISAKGKIYPCCWLAVSEYTLDKFKIVKESWSSNPVKICLDTCGQNQFGSSFTCQWQREIELQ